MIEWIEFLPYILFIFALGYVYTVPANDTDYPDELYIIELQDEKLDRDGAIACTGTQMWDKGADIASADPLVPGADGNFFHVTGTTNFTAINAAQSQPGTPICLVFDGILTMTHHATDLILPGGANIMIAAGDRAIFVEESVDKWRCVVYQRADGTPIAGGGIANVVEDLTPQLGGDLDLNAKNLDFPSTPNISDVKDEDDMASDSAVMLATQQSIKAYVDSFNLFKVISSTRDLTAASGDVGYTGVGFVPKAVIAIGSKVGSAHSILNIGFSDGTVHRVIYTYGYNLVSAINSNYLFYALPAAVNYQHAIVKTFDADGLTLTWTKNNSPTGTLAFALILLR